MPIPPGSNPSDATGAALGSTSRDPQFPQKRIPGGLLKPHFEQINDIPNALIRFLKLIIPANSFSPDGSLSTSLVQSANGEIASPEKPVNY
jgi:hypothetical protein